FAADGPLAHLVLKLHVPFLDKLVAKVPPIVKQVTPYEAVYKFDWLSATGAAIMLAAIVTIAFLRMKPAEAVRTFGDTLKSLAIPIYSIGMVL
ncbi:L-lactate permease, partial [Klebsiella pneumoniae]|nr:L-lactate permease [Klebsiella pneumoniae]